MTAEDLAEMMINGDLDYVPDPDSDYCFIAEQHVRLCKAIKAEWEHIPNSSRENLTTILNHNPANL